MPSSFLKKSSFAEVAKDYDILYYLSFYQISLIHLSESAGGGVWAVYPVVFSISYFYGIFHSIITIFLAISTLSTFSLAAFRCAGTPPSILWGSYPAVGKGGLENYTFCHSCSKPKSPRTHHCRSCGMCVLDMDHHCPFVSICNLSTGNITTAPLSLFVIFQQRGNPQTATIFLDLNSDQFANFCIIWMETLHACVHTSVFV